MPLTATDARALMAAVLAAYGEDYDQVGKLLTELRSRLGALAWMTALGTEANTAFSGTGLSIDWWLAEVDRRSA